MKFCIIGCGRLGIAIGNALMLRAKRNTVGFYEPLPEMRQRLHDGEFAEMLMVAAATGNDATWHEDIPQDFDAYIVTAGVPRKSSLDSKTMLYAGNYPIVLGLCTAIPHGAPIFVATNPPKEIAETLDAQGFSTMPLRDCTDNLRRQVWGSEWKVRNDAMLDAKGYTSYAPAIAIALEVLLWAEPVL